MTAYYNEHDKYAAAWLRNLIAAGHIAPGIVDERSIEDVRPSDLAGFRQCHFFAGVGVWSLALRRAGWPDDRPVWTGSCPCQPFSAAGAGVGFDDERHLWPAFFHLIEQCRPPVVIGEQVASKNADPWIDLVQDDLEALDYAFGAVPFPSAGIGAPHIRDRLYWVADAGQSQRRRRADHGALQLHGSAPERDEGAGNAEWDSGVDGMANPQREPCGCQAKAANHHRPQIDRPADRACGCGSTSGTRPSPTNGLWRAADWLLCRDGKWRPVEPGTFPLAHGAASRVGRLRAYGNAINAKAAEAFIEAVMEA